MVTKLKCTKWHSMRPTAAGSHQALVNCGLNTWGSYRLEKMAQGSALSHRVAIIPPKLKTKPTPRGLVYMLEQWPVFWKERQQNRNQNVKNCHICAETWRVWEKPAWTTKSRFGKTSSEKKEVEFILLNLQTVTQNIKKLKEMTPETQWPIEEHEPI